MVETFLSCFIFATSSKIENQIDLNLILKALPVRVDKTNVYRIELFNFGSVQASLTAFTNTDQDERFKYFDDRNKARLRKLRIKATTTEELTYTLKGLSARVNAILEKIQEKGAAGHTVRDLHTMKKESIKYSTDEIKRIKL